MLNDRNLASPVSDSKEDRDARTKASADLCEDSLRKHSSKEDPDTVVPLSLDHYTTYKDVPHSMAPSGDKEGGTILTALAFPDEYLCPTSMYPPLQTKFY